MTQPLGQIDMFHIIQILRADYAFGRRLLSLARKASTRPGHIIPDADVADTLTMSSDGNLSIQIQSLCKMHWRPFERALVRTRGLGNGRHLEK